MENNDIDGLIARFLASEGTPEETERLDRWLAEEESHVRYFYRCKNLYDVNHPAFSLEDIHVEKAYRKIFDSQNYGRKVLWRKLIAVAAVVFVVMTSGILYFLREENRPVVLSGDKALQYRQVEVATLMLSTGEEILLDEPGVRGIAGNDIARVEKNVIEYVPKDSVVEKEEFHLLRVPRGGEFFLTLSDGTKIWVNADTKVRYPVRFAGKERRIFVEGEAYLEVARDTTSPFKVVMPRNEVVVLGTSFNVTSYPEEKSDRVTLVSGKVNVRSGIAGQSLVLHPGEQVVVDKEDGKMEKRSVDTELYCSWREGELAFKSSSLEYILNTLARRYNLMIHWQDESLKRLSFSGEIKKYDQIDRLLKMISHTGDVKFAIQDRDIIVSKP